MNKDQMILANLKAAVAAKRENDEKMFTLLCERLKKEYNITVDPDKPNKTLKDFAKEHPDLALDPPKDNNIACATPKGDSYEITPLVPIEQIIEEFDQFKKENPDIKCEYSKQQNKDGSTVHTFKFENKEDMEKFLNRLFGKGMISMPNGSMKLPNAKTDDNNLQTIINSEDENNVNSTVCNV